MTVKDKIQMDIRGLCENGPINIVIPGNSVSPKNYIIRL